MESFESVVVSCGAGCRFEAVCDEWNETCVVYARLPLECEVCVSSKLV